MARRKHGTRASYAAGCRCQRCRGAWAGYIKGRRHRLGRTRDAALVRREVRSAESTIERAEMNGQRNIAVRVRLTPLAYRIITERQQKSAARRDVVVDEVVRESAHG